MNVKEWNRAGLKFKKTSPHNSLTNITRKHRLFWENFFLQKKRLSLLRDSQSRHLLSVVSSCWMQHLSLSVVFFFSQEKVNRKNFIVTFYLLLEKFAWMMDKLRRALSGNDGEDEERGFVAQVLMCLLFQQLCRVGCHWSYQTIIFYLLNCWLGCWIINIELGNACERIYRLFCHWNLSFNSWFSIPLLWWCYCFFCVIHGRKPDCFNKVLVPM